MGVHGIWYFLFVVYIHPPDSSRLKGTGGDKIIKNITGVAGVRFLTIKIPPNNIPSNQKTT